MQLGRRLRVRAAVRIGLLFAGVPLAYLLLAGVAFYAHHAARAEASVRLLPVALPPTASTRLLVVAPHCDDETLGCGGLIQQTLRNQGTARVVVLTNGDGFRTAVEEQTRQLRVQPSDYIAFAAVRQRESTRALSDLGLGPRDVLFFGYPDRGLLPIWNSHWSATDPYFSSYTRRTSSPYALTFDTHASYSGADLVADLRRAFRAFRPTEIAVTHPGDDHPDHAAAAAFVAEALREAVADPRDAAWAPKARLVYYMVHRGDWPLPQGYTPADPLAPPAEMDHVDTRWTVEPLTAAQTLRKAAGINDYPSQTAMMGRFLRSFARTNELFGEIPTVRLRSVADGRMRVDADPSDWTGIAPVEVDPVSDNVLRELQGSADIRAMYACRDAWNLYLRVDTRLPVSPRTSFALHIRPFSTTGASPDGAITVRANAGARATEQVAVASQGRTIEVAIPWRRLCAESGCIHVAALAVSAETSVAGVGVDSTGIRMLVP